MKPPIFVITCDELPDRKEACERHFREKGVSAHFPRGIHGKSWGLETRLEFDKGKCISSGHVALNINHYMCWQLLDHTLHYGGDYGVVFEDDAVLPDNLYGVMEGVTEELKEKRPDWDVVFLGSGDAGIRTWNKITERIGGPTSRFCKQEFPWGTHALMIRKKALPTLMRLMSRAERNMDQQLYVQVLKDNHVQWCMVLPSLVQQRTYDHAGVGKPEWKPSTIDKPEQEEPRPFTVSPELYKLTMDLIDPFACIYRGEFLSDPGYGVTAEGQKKSVVVSECARLNAICHIRTDVANVERNEKKVVPCGDCKERSAIAKNENMAPLPFPSGHFNPSMLLYDGRIIAVTRDSWGHSALSLWELRNNDLVGWTDKWSVFPIGNYRSPSKYATRLEDPRLFMAYDEEGNYKLHASVSLPDGYPPTYVNVGYVRFKLDLSGIEHTHIFESPFGNAYEKNWVCFLDDKKMRWVYGTKPDHIILNEKGKVLCQTPNKLPWKGGALRGGAAPFLTGWKQEIFCHFTHGCLKVSRGNVYTVGCTIFSAKIPYPVVLQTPIPLIWPEAYGGDENVVKRNVVFPGGAIMRGDDVFIIAGRDDTDCVMYRLKGVDLRNALTNKPEEEGNETISIRSTPISKGVSLPKGEK